MAGEPILHLMKGGRILQYRQQNVAMVGAPEQSEFEIFYGSRWLAPDTAVGVGDSAIIVFGDSPYKRLDPIRYATVTASETTRSGLQITVRLGPFVVVDGGASTVATPVAHPAGGLYFVWRAPVDGLRPPITDHEVVESWRDAVDRLRHNGFYEQSRFVRLAGVVDSEGASICGRSLQVGSGAVAQLEIRSALGPAADQTVVVDSDPVGAIAGGVRGVRSDADGALDVPLRATTAGVHHVTLSMAPAPLLSTRVRFDLDIASPRAATTGSAPSADQPGVPTDIQPELVVALTQRLSRIDAIGPEQWLDLLHANLLPLAPDEPVMRSMVAEVAAEQGEHPLVVELLDDPENFRGDDALRRLTSGLSIGAPTDVHGLLNSIDLGLELNVSRLASELAALPDGAIREVTEVLLDELAGREVLDRLLCDVFPRLRPDLAIRVASECAPADPDAWLARLIKRWPSPMTIPDEALRQLLSLDMNTPKLGPYLNEQIGRCLDDGDLAGVLELDELAKDTLPPADQIWIRLSTARLLLEEAPGQARALLLSAAEQAHGLADLDLLVELSMALRGLPSPPEGNGRAAADAARRLEDAVESSGIVTEWRAARDADTAARLQPFLSGRVLHLVGGQRGTWADELAEALNLRDLRWHESSKTKKPDLDWVNKFDKDRDLVALIWTNVGHSSSQKLNSANIEYLKSRSGRPHLLECLTEWADRQQRSGHDPSQ